MQRSAKKELAWVLAVSPTHAAAQEAGVSLKEYQQFVYEACMLHTPSPVDSWKKLSSAQEALVTYLNGTKVLRFVGKKTDIVMSMKDRLWINSDGVHNMPSGEVFSGPIEDSVNGEIFFDVPTIYEGQDVSGIHLIVKDGVIVDWDAAVGKNVLDRVFTVDGANRFGEVAIGTNYSIQKPSKNILFDEKIGGTIHMAVGASYPETGGLNQSAVHWDMIKYMQEGGQIFADDQLIYENGQFLLNQAQPIKELFDLKAAVR